MSDDLRVECDGPRFVLSTIESMWDDFRHRAHSPTLAVRWHEDAGPVLSGRWYGAVKQLARPLDSARPWLISASLELDSVRR